MLQRRARPRALVQPGQQVGIAVAAMHLAAAAPHADDLLDQPRRRVGQGGQMVRPVDHHLVARNRRVLVGDDAHLPAGRVVLPALGRVDVDLRAASRARGPRRTGSCGPHRPVSCGRWRPAGTPAPARSAPVRRSAGCDEGLVSSSPNTGTTGLGSEAIVTLSSRFTDATDHPLHLRGNASNGRTRPGLTLRCVRRSLGAGGADRDGRPAGAAAAGDDPRAAHVPAGRRELEGRRPARGARRARAGRGRRGRRSCTSRRRGRTTRRWCSCDARAAAPSPTCTWRSSPARR